MSQNFQKNDRIRVKDNGFFGTIEGVSFNSIQQEWEYYVAWDSYPGQGPFCYTASNTDNLWEKVAEIKDAVAGADPGFGYTNQDGNLVLPMGGHRTITHDGDKVKMGCDHKWVEVGFNHTKTVCYHCDAEKP